MLKISVVLSLRKIRPRSQQRVFPVFSHSITSCIGPISFEAFFSPLFINLGMDYTVEVRESLFMSHLSFYSVSFTDQTQVIRLGSKCLYPLSHLDSTAISPTSLAILSLISFELFLSPTSGT